MSLTDRISAARQRLRDGSLANEASVSIGVVLPILDALGWPAFDPGVVAPEYSVGTRRVDFALLTRGTPAVFVEVKQPGLMGRADRQLFEYAFHEGVPFAVLTDGATWHFYMPSLQGSYDDRRVYMLDLLERDPSESAARLGRYLERNAVESGDAEERARSDHKRSRQRKGAEAAIPQAWANIAQEPRLADLLSAEVESVCGFQPEPGDLAAFLASLRPGTATLPIVSTSRPAPALRVEEPRSPAPPVPKKLVAWSHGSWVGKGVTLPEGTELRANLKAKSFTASVRDGLIVFQNRGYNTPSAAGRAATGYETNGWRFWEVKRPGDAGWIVLSSLRD